MKTVLGFVMVFVGVICAFLFFAALASSNPHPNAYFNNNLNASPNRSLADNPVVSSNTDPEASSPYRAPVVSLPWASNTAVAGTSECALDYSNAASGYVMVKYTGLQEYAFVKIFHGEADSTFKVPNSDGYTALPLTFGNGVYTVNFYEPANPAADESVIKIFKWEGFVELDDEYAPYLYPNQLVWFTEESAAVQHGAELLDASMTDSEVIAAVYEYVVEVIQMDFELESQILSGAVDDRIVLDVDTIYTEHCGVCLDYAVLMTALLRSQQIPAKLVFGFANDDWHAWVSVYTDEAGWVTYDPTSGASEKQGNYLNYLFASLVENTPVSYEEVYVY